MYTLGNKIYRTKKDIEEKAKEILNKGERSITPWDCPKEYHFLQDLLNRHPNASHKIDHVIEGGENTYYFIVLISPMGRGYSFYVSNHPTITGTPRYTIKGNDFYDTVTETDVRLKDFSYKKCIRNQDKVLYREKMAAYRKAVQSDILDFANKNRKPGQEDFQVDHVKPRFVDLVREFEKTNKLRLKPVLREASNGAGKVFDERLPDVQLMVGKWKQFHKEHAVLTMISPEDHLKKSLEEAKVTMTRTDAKVLVKQLKKLESHMTYMNNNSDIGTNKIIETIFEMFGDLEE